MSSFSPIDRFYQALLANKILTTTSHAYYRQYLKQYWFRRILETLFIAALINSSQMFSLVSGEVMALSPTTGVALSAVFMRGYTALVGIFLGLMLGQLVHAAPFLFSFSNSIFFTFYIFILREICLQWVGATLPLPNLTIFLKFLFVCAVIAFGFVGTLNFIFPIQATIFTQWLAQMNGILYLTPLCLAFDPYSPEKLFNKNQPHWWLGLIGLLILQTVLFLLPQTYHWFTSTTMILAIVAYGYFFNIVKMGIALLCLSALYIGLDQNTPLVFALQAGLGLSLSLIRSRV